MEEDYEREQEQALKNIKLRNYQLKLLEKAKKENTILYLPTGAGKTLIAVHVLCSRGFEIRRPYNEGGKRAFFLANTKVLVHQLSKVLKTHTKFTIASFTGDMNVDTWSREKWMNVFQKAHVLVITAEILKQILQVEFIRPNNISLIVFDECHHAVENHPYRLVLECLDEVDPSEGPLRLGLSAVLLNSNPKNDQFSTNIQTLEAAFKGKVITESELSEVLSFSTCPQEKIVLYEETVELIEAIHSLYQNTINVVSDMVLRPLDSPTLPKEGHDFKNKNKAKRIKNSLVNSLEHFKEFGLFGGYISALFYIILLEKMRLLSKNEVEIKALIYGVTELNKIRHVAHKIIGEVENGAIITRYSSDKLRKLFQIIKETEKEKRPSVIIFVYQRASAIILAFILKRLSTVDKEFSFIRPEFVVGSSLFSKETVLLGSKNEDIIKQFAAGSLNLLVATNVLEEGIDISECNTVISFDFPKAYPSYFQSKGRARNKESSYYVFVHEHDQGKKEGLLAKYKALEKEIFKVVSGSSGSRESEEVSFKEVEKITVGGNITVDGLLAIKAVERYCRKLPQDRYSLLSPMAWYVNVGDAKKRGFVQLPVNCPLREVVEGEARESQKEAKRAAFLAAVKRLYDMGELDDDLNPKSFEVKKVFDHLFPHYKNEKIDKSLPQPGTRRRRQMYRTKFAESLSNCLPRPGVKAYLHVMDLDIAFNKPELDRKIAIYDVLRNPVTFAIISTKKLYKIFEFPLFLDMGQINCNFLVNYDEIVLNEKEINDIKSCHFALFKKITKSLKTAHVFDISDKYHSFFVVPVEKNEAGRFVLSWDVIRSDFCRNTMSALVRYNPTANRDRVRKRSKVSDSRRIRDASESSTALVPMDVINGRLLWAVGRDEESHGPAFTMTEADYRFFIVIPNYRKQDPPQCYIVDKFCRDMSPLTEFPRDNYDDYIAYYRDKYEINITNAKQPLLKVSPLYSCSNFNRPRDRKPLRARERHKEYQEHLVPELCDIVPFDKRFWVKALLIPTVLNRIYHVYCVEEFRRRIVTETGLGMLEPPLETGWLPLGVDEVCIDKEKEEEIGRSESWDLRSALPLSKLKDKTQHSPVILDPERHLYDCGLCDLQNYVRCLEDESEEFEESFQETMDAPVIIPIHTGPIPTLKLLKCSNNKTGPELAMLVQACTSKSANDIVNYERLETLGDSFLKFAATFYLFRNFTENEGVLTDVKGKIVGNKNLMYCALARNIQDVINVIDFVPQSDWTPPLLSVPERLVENIINNKVDPAVVHRFQILDEEQFSGVLSETTLRKNEEIIQSHEKYYEFPTNSLLPYKLIEDKTISDCVEALIGSYVLTLGFPGGFEFLSWLGILPKSKTLYKELMETPYEPSIYETGGNSLIMNILGEVFYSELEDLLNYRFKNKALLLEAITHPSYTKNRVTNCYQRLELLGDAVLDFLITTYVYEYCGCLTPGQITDIRSSLVNNITFACLVVRYEIYKYMLSFSSTLSKAIQSFVSFQKERDHMVDDNVLVLLEENDCLIAETIQVPKALGDIFESLAGAIFLDSGNSLEAVWEVYYRLMKKEIVRRVCQITSGHEGTCEKCWDSDTLSDNFTKTVPKTSVRLLHDICGDKPYYETSSLQGVTKVTCSVFFDNCQIEAHGFGPNKKEAKRSAAKLVLNKILTLKK